MPEPNDVERNAELYEQLAHASARLLVVHETSRILSSTHDAQQLATQLLATIADAVFASSGCVAAFEDDAFEVLATHGLDAEAAEALATTAGEAAVWFEVVEGDDTRTADELQEAFDSVVEDGEEGDREEGEDTDEVDDDGDDEESPDWDDEEDDGWQAEDDGVEGDGPVFELYIPLTIEDRSLGLLALGARVDQEAHTAADRELAESLATHLALALSAAELTRDKQRRIEQLSVLLRISKEITSTLDIDRVLGTAAQMLTMVVPNRRTTISLVHGTSIELRAASDPAFDLRSAARDPLLPAVRWAHGARQTVNTCLGMLELDDEAEGRDILLEALGRPEGPRGLAVLPLEDDQGVLGFLAIESDEDSPPLDDDSEELVGILANQATVAIRNAELYHRMPMVGMLDPIIGKRGGSKRRRVRLAVAAVLVLIGFLLPLPAWVSGNAEVRPALLLPVRAETEGTVDEIFVEEGDQVTAGQRLARMRQDEIALAVEQTRAAILQARAAAGRARREADLSSYSSAQAELDRLAEEERFLLVEMKRTELRATDSGTILTPRVDLLLGERLTRGATFVEMADLSTMEIEVDVPEDEIGNVDLGTEGRLKVHAYPGKTFRGEVVLIAPRAEDVHLFRVTLRIDNSDGALKPGMTGRAHVDIPSRPLLRTLFRPLWRWLRVTFWV